MACNMVAESLPTINTTNEGNTADMVVERAEQQPKIILNIEVCLHERSTAIHQEVRLRVKILLSTRSLAYRDGPILVDPSEDAYLALHVQDIKLCDTNKNNTSIYGQRLPSWQVELDIHIFQLNEEGPAAAEDGDSDSPAYCEWQLPARNFFGLWDSLILAQGLKQQLLQYACTAMRFGQQGVNPHLISFNRTVLLHGPPGTGKTSLCKALAQKLAIRYSHRYPQSQLIEVNAHSLFSKWFSESGKLVTALFSRIREAVEEEDNLVFVLVDERVLWHQVESLTGARKAAILGSEPADSVRAVNALLTALDTLKSFPNVMLLTTSNLSEAIDAAFLDRVDIKAYLGPPELQARYEILRTCVVELQRSGIVSSSFPPPPPYQDLSPQSSVFKPDAAQEAGQQLYRTAEACLGLSGRALRKLPFLAHVELGSRLSVDGEWGSCGLSAFLTALAEVGATSAAQTKVNSPCKALIS